MPAIEHSFGEPPPSDLYLDVDLAVAYLVDNQPHHLRSTSFIDNLARNGQTTVCISSLAWLEFAHVVGRDRFRRTLPEDMVRKLLSGAWESRRTRTAYLRTFMAYFEEMLHQFMWKEVPLAPSVRETAVDLMAEYALDSHDAVHLASAALSGVQHFASLDEAFRRVEGLHLWNDRIHARR